ncbi:hypothetical protein PoB_003107900 [Plakobranchus ocellatus]|uniref:Uncharacterized protein n=1 Tax=Plakobranchus ocellatus TaxID=259542 RepID=A0AAV4AE99_9GAST|nr:hypothetical protein PoB_003107900 [Plakobranchus ocellatus]
MVSSDRALIARGYVSSFLPIGPMYKLVSGGMGAASGVLGWTGIGARSIGTPYFAKRSWATLSTDAFLILRRCVASSSTIDFNGAPSPFEGTSPGPRRCTPVCLRQLM